MRKKVFHKIEHMTDSWFIIPKIEVFGERNSGATRPADGNAWAEIMFVVGEVTWHAGNLFGPGFGRQSCEVIDENSLVEVDSMRTRED